MMKSIWKAIILSVILTFTGMAVNYMQYQKDGHLKFCTKMWGGEITVERGFGLQMRHIFAMTPQESDIISLDFDPFSLIVCFLLVFLIVYLLITIIPKLLKKRA